MIKCGACYAEEIQEAVQFLKHSRIILVRCKQHEIPEPLFLPGEIEISKEEYVLLKVMDS